MIVKLITNVPKTSSFGACNLFFDPIRGHVTAQVPKRRPKSHTMSGIATNLRDRSAHPKAPIRNRMRSASIAATADCMRDPFKNYGMGKNLLKRVNIRGMETADTAKLDRIN